ncbi:hypothetical protein DVG78_28095 [Runella aurantiaca]|uniref:Uncharacterized protein n=1 Tax=Runella aurantiaca TaxID=2282308 RepID=A0A369I118_9BACT|nr:hypothetical protein DVG78_28095 [Runella aurantiaca]
MRTKIDVDLVKRDSTTFDEMQLLRRLGFYWPARFSLSANNVFKPMVYAGIGEKDSGMVYLQKAADLDVIHSDVSVNPSFKICQKHSIFRMLLASLT